MLQFENSENELQNFAQINQQNEYYRSCHRCHSSASLNESNIDKEKNINDDSFELGLGQSEHSYENQKISSQNNDILEICVPKFEIYQSGSQKQSSTKKLFLQFDQQSQNVQFKKILPIKNAQILNFPHVYTKLTDQKQQLTTEIIKFERQENSKVCVLIQQAGVADFFQIKQYMKLFRNMHENGDDSIWEFLQNSFEQINNKLIQMHEQGIVHGDIKPQNIVISHDGSFYFIDFDESIYRKEEKIELKQISYHLKHKTSYYNSSKIIELIQNKEKKDIFSSIQILQLIDRQQLYLTYIYLICQSQELLKLFEEKKMESIISILQNNYKKQNDRNCDKSTEQLESSINHQNKNFTITSSDNEYLHHEFQNQIQDTIDDEESFINLKQQFLIQDLIINHQQLENNQIKSHQTFNLYSQLINQSQECSQTTDSKFDQQCGIQGISTQDGLGCKDIFSSYEDKDKQQYNSDHNSLQNAKNNCEKENINDKQQYFVVDEQLSLNQINYEFVNYLFEEYFKCEKLFEFNQDNKNFEKIINYLQDQKNKQINFSGNSHQQNQFASFVIGQKDYDQMKSEEIQILSLNLNTAFWLNKTEKKYTFDENMVINELVYLNKFSKLKEKLKEFCLNKLQSISEKDEENEYYCSMFYYLHMQQFIPIKQQRYHLKNNLQLNNFIQALQLMPQMNTLIINISKEYQMDAYLIKKLLQTLQLLPNLKQLSLSLICQNIDYLFYYLGKLFQKVEKFQLKVSTISLAIDSNFPSQVQYNIKYLDMSFNTSNITDNYLVNIGQFIQKSQLETIKLSFPNCQKITDNGVEQIFSSLNLNIKILKRFELNLTLCKNITQQTIKSLQDFLIQQTNLHIQINLSNCEKIKPSSFHNLLNFLCFRSFIQQTLYIKYNFLTEDVEYEQYLAGINKQYKQIKFIKN